MPGDGNCKKVFFGSTQMETSDKLMLIGVCTYQRPSMLAELLKACARISSVPGMSLGLLIVDNDPGGSARQQVENARQYVPIPIHYRIEPARGISNARNRVLVEAISLNAGYLALIDDDEIMRPDWLVELFAALKASDADAVGAPSYWDLPAGVASWHHALPTSPHYIRRRRDEVKSRKPRLYPSTNNVLMSARLYRDLGIRFDVRFGMTGGEDTDFFKRAKNAGARYTFTDKAAVLETIPPSRLTLRWRFWRWAGVARGNVRMHRLQQGQIEAWRHYLPRCFPKLLTGPLFLFAAPIMGPEMMLRGVKHLGGAVGILQELLGRNHEEYTTIHGD